MKSYPIFEDFDGEVLDAASQLYFLRHGLEGLGTSWYTIHTLLTTSPLSLMVSPNSRNFISNNNQASKRMMRTKKDSDLHPWTLPTDLLPHHLSLCRQEHRKFMQTQASRSLFYYKRNYPIDLPPSPSILLANPYDNTNTENITNTSTTISTNTSNIDTSRTVLRFMKSL